MTTTTSSRPWRCRRPPAGPSARPTWRRARVVIAAAVVVVSGCGTGSDANRPHEESPTGSERSHPFEVGWVPDGYELVVAGTGSDVPEWSDESAGSTPNLTVLRPRGGSVADDVLVSADGGDEGFPANHYHSAGEVTRPSGDAVSLPPPSPSPPPPPSPSPSPANRARPVNILYQAKGDVQLYVKGRAGERVLRAVARAVTMPDRNGAPVIANPPDDLEVVGSVSADAALALTPYFAPGYGTAPGPTSAHAAAWQGAEADLVVLTIPGRSLDLDVVADHPGSAAFGTEAERRTIADRPAVVLRPEPSSVPGGGLSPTVVLTETADGDVAVVAAIPRRHRPVETTAAAELTIPPPIESPSDGDLMKTAGSIGAVHELTWSSFVERASCGPGFHADPGAVALASGERSSIGWILQDPPGADGGSVGGTGGPDGTLVTAAVPSCLKLSNGDRPCANMSQGGGAVPGQFLSISTGSSSIGSFVIVERSRPGGELRLTTSAGTDQRPMVAVPSENRSASVVFSDQPPGPLWCPAPPDQARLEVVEDDGSVTCLGGTR